MSLSPPAQATAVQPWQGSGPLFEVLLSHVRGRWRGVVSATERCIAAGLEIVPARPLVAEGAWVLPGQPLAEVVGSAVELARAEDSVLGDLGVASGVATAAARLLAEAPPGLRVVCGGWKKLPAAMKPAVRRGLEAAGVGPRLLDGRFVYVGKNEVALLGGVAAATRAAQTLAHGPVAVQVRDLPSAIAATRSGAGVVMVDNGDLKSLAEIDDVLRSTGLRTSVLLAFGGGVTSDDLAVISAAGADIVDVGRAILAAPIIDLRFDVVLSDA